MKPPSLSRIRPYTLGAPLSSKVNERLEPATASAYVVAKPAKLVDFTASASPSRLWSASAGKGERRLGLRQTPTVADGRVYAAAVDGGVHAFDLQTGARAWTWRTDMRVTGGPGGGYPGCDGGKVPGYCGADMAPIACLPPLSASAAG